MAKQGGLGDNLYIGGYDLSGDIGSIKKIGGGPAVLEVTAIDKSAMERIGGVRDGMIDFTAYFNKAVGAAHLRLAPLPLTDTQAQYWRGTTIGAPVAAALCKQVNYDPDRGDDGSFTFDVSMVANGYGIDWGNGLTAGKRVDTVATNGAGIDLTTVSTLFGWQAYLQVLAFTGTSATVTVQDSADNVTFANLTGGVFTAATGVTHERLAGTATATVRRYVRAITTGTFSSVTFAVAFTRNLTLVS